MDQEQLIRWGQTALDLAVENATNGGGPFGAVIMRDGVVIARGTNNVTRHNDPTAHAEVVAIREACALLEDYQLTDCILITSCEPCPMCLGAAYWSRVSAVYYIAEAPDAAAAGFDDSFIYDELKIPHSDRRIPFIHLPMDDYNKPFEAWNNNLAKKLY